MTFRPGHRHRAVRTPALVLAATLLALMSVASCTLANVPDHERNVDVLGAALPTLARLSLHNMYAGDCLNIRYARGYFISRPDCVSGYQGLEPRAMDAQAREAIDTIEEAVAGTGQRVVAASVEYNPAGEPSGARFSLGSCHEYVYDPGYSELEKVDSADVSVIDPDWYVISWGIFYC